MHTHTHTHTHTHSPSLSLSLIMFSKSTNFILAKSGTLKLCLEGRQHSVVGHNLGRTSRAYLAELKKGAVCQVSQLGQVRFGQPTPPSQRAKALTRDNPPTIQRITSYLQGFRGRTLVLILQTTDYRLHGLGNPGSPASDLVGALQPQGTR